MNFFIDLLNQKLKVQELIRHKIESLTILDTFESDQRNTNLKVKIRFAWVNLKKRKKKKIRITFHKAFDALSGVIYSLELFNMESYLVYEVK